MNLSERTALREALQNDEAAAADYETLIGIMTEVVVAGEGTQKMLADCKPYLVALHRSGIDPTHAVITGKESAIIRGMQIKARKEGN